MDLTIIVIVIAVFYLLYDRLPLILAHREKMAQLKKERNDK